MTAGKDSSKTRKLILLVSSLLVAGIVGLILFRWFEAPMGVGESVAQLRSSGNEKYTFVWSASCREKIEQYCKRLGVNIAHFSGSIELNDPKSQNGDYTIGLADGKLSTYGAHFKGDLLADVEKLRNSNLREMLKSTKNDWRVVNHDGNFIEPNVPKFSGKVLCEAGEMGFLRMIKEINVVEDKVVSTSTSFMPAD